MNENPPEVTSDMPTSSVSASPETLPREAISLGAILLTTLLLASLERHGIVPWTGYPSSLVLLGLSVWHKWRFGIAIKFFPTHGNRQVLSLVLPLALGVFLMLAACLSSRSGGTRSPSLSEMLHLLILVPLAEELYFRGLLFEHLQRGFAPLRAALLCSLLFAVLHLPLILLPLVAAIEAVVLARLLGTKPLESFITSAKANWRSTIVGLPTGWCMALAGLIPAGFLAYFLPTPYRDPAFQIIAFTAFTGGIIPTRFSMIAVSVACLLLLVPYYIATVRVERKVVQARHPHLDPERVADAVRWANRLSYCLLALLLLRWLMTAIVDYRKHVEDGAEPARASSAAQLP